jgi:hypothetical protein
VATVSDGTGKGTLFMNELTIPKAFNLKPQDLEVRELGFVNFL